MCLWNIDQSKLLHLNLIWFIEIELQLFSDESHILEFGCRSMSVKAKVIVNLI